MITWDRALYLAQKWSGDASPSMATDLAMLLNLGYKDILTKFNGEETEDVRTTATQPNYRAIKLAPNYIRMHSITVTEGNRTYDLVEEESQDKFGERIQSNRSSSRPEVYFLRPRFGVGGTELLLDPIPSSANTILTISYAATARDLSQPAYKDGTVSISKGSQTLNGSGTTFTPAMVGRYFQVTDSTGDGWWYRITGFTSPTALTIENQYDGATISGKSYTINEMFGLPEEMQILPVYWAMAHYYLGYRQDKDEKRSALWETRYKVGLREAETRYKRKGKGNVLHQKEGVVGWPMHPVNFPASVSGS